MLEGVVIRDHDFRAANFGEHLRRHEFARLVVIILVAWLDDSQPILDRDARGDDQERPRKILRILASGVHRLPGNQHGHDGCLAAARRHLQGEAEQRRIGLFIRLSDLIEEALRCGALGGDLGQPDNRLDGFQLAEEWARTDELMMAPMFQEPLRYAGDTPIGRIAQRAPSIEIAANFVDQRIFAVGFEIKGRLAGRRLLP